MKKILFAIVLFGAVGMSQAQVPGFQGKRCVISAQLGVGHGGIFGRPGAMPSLVPTLNIEYAMKRHISIVPYYSFMYYSYKSYNNNLYYNDIPAKDLKNSMMMHQIGCNFKFYRKGLGYLAPVGRYFTLGAFYNYTSQNIYTDFDRVTLSYPSVERMHKYKAQTHNFGITGGIGRTFVIARRMTIDFGGNINLMPYFKLNSGKGGEDIVENEARRNMLLRNIWQIYLGIGFLAF